MALELCTKSLAIRIKVMGAKHAEMDAAHNYNDSLALIFQKQNKDKMELGLYAKLLAIRIEAMGAEHSGVAAAYSNIALVYEKQGKYIEALEQAREVPRDRHQGAGRGPPGRGRHVRLHRPRLREASRG